MCREKKVLSGPGCCLDFKAELDRTPEHIQVLIEDHNRLVMLSREVERDLKSIDDLTEPLRSLLPALEVAIEAGKQSKESYFRSIQCDLEHTSKEILDAYNLTDELELPALFQTSDQKEICAHLADLAAALGDAKARLHS